MSEVTITVGIPVYNARKHLFRTLCSVATQTKRPDKVIILDDCSKDRYDDILAQFDLPFAYMSLEKNYGCGVARQAILEACDTDYLVFLDADDMFCNNFWMENVIEVANAKGKPSVIVPNFWQQTGRGTELKRGVETQPWCHGKAYNMAYIKRKGLRFPTQRVCEDVAFNAVLFNIAEDVCLVDIPSYLWMQTAGSITRAGDYVFDTYEEYLSACRYGVEGILKLGKRVRAQAYALKTAMTTHQYIEMFKVTKRDKMMVRKYEKLLKQYLKDLGINEMLKDTVFGDFVKRESGYTIEEFIQADTQHLCGVLGMKMEVTLLDYLKANEL